MDVMRSELARVPGVQFEFSRPSLMTFSSPLGVTLALASTLVWASNWLVNQTEKRDPLLRLMVNFIAGTLWMAVLMQLTGQWRLPDQSALVGAVYIGLFEMGLTFALWSTALSLSSGVSRVGNLIFLSPLVSMIFIATILGEAIHPAVQARDDRRVISL